MSKQKNEAYNNGIAMHKQVMGEDHVKRSMSQATEFTAPSKTG